MDNNHVLYVRFRTKFVRICTLFVIVRQMYIRMAQVLNSK